MSSSGLPKKDRSVRSDMTLVEMLTPRLTLPTVCVTVEIRVIEVSEELL